MFYLCAVIHPGCGKTVEEMLKKEFYIGQYIKLADAWDAARLWATCSIIWFEPGLGVWMIRDVESSFTEI